MQNKVMKYMTRIGQKTGMLKNSKKVQTKAITVALVAEYQNLNSGRRLMNGRNSSFWRVGNSGPSSVRKRKVVLNVQSSSLSLVQRTIIGPQVLSDPVLKCLTEKGLPTGSSEFTPTYRSITNKCETTHTKMTSNSQRLGIYFHFHVRDP